MSCTGTSRPCIYYKSMVRPILEYAGDPHTTANIQKLESVQRRAARFCLNFMIIPVTPV